MANTLLVLPIVSCFQSTNVSIDLAMICHMLTVEFLD